MKGLVSIFGGIKTKVNHYKYASEVYKRNGFRVDFYEGSHYGMGTLIPKLYKINVERAIEKTRNENLPKIIHSNSGGFWTGLEVNSQIQHNAFVLESSPLNCYNIENCFQVVNKVYFRNMLPTNKKLIELAMRQMGIPTMNSTPEWFEEYEKHILKLQNVYFLNGDKDEFIDNGYLNRFGRKLYNNNIKFQTERFKEGKHHNVAKSDVALYQQAIESICANALAMK
jgi:hypothetical protein